MLWEIEAQGTIGAVTMFQTYDCTCAKSLSRKRTYNSKGITGKVKVKDVAKDKTRRVRPSLFHSRKHRHWSVGPESE